MTWTLLPVGRFQDAETDWQELVRRYHAGHPLLDSKFVMPLIAEFANERTQLALAKSEGRIVGALIVEPSAYGVLNSFAPSQSQLCLAVNAPHTGSANPAALLALHKKSGWLLGLRNYDTQYLTLIDTHDARTECIEYGETMSIKLDGTFEQYWNARSRNLRKNIKRYLNRAESDGYALRLEVITDAHRMRPAVAQYGVLESAGWKGKEGTAIHAENQQGRFYTSILENFSRSGGARVYHLYFNEELVAARLTIEQNAMMVILKTTYNEQFAKYAPSRLLLYFILQHAFEHRAFQLIEFYTKANADQLQWCTHQRMIHHINFYRSGVIKKTVVAMRTLKGMFSKKSGVEPEQTGGE